MASVIIYTKKAEPYCVRAKALLDAKRVPFIEKELPEHAHELIKLAGTDKVPQIFINDRHVGDYEKLGSLELKGELDKLLKEHGHSHMQYHEDQPRN